MVYTLMFIMLCLIPLVRMVMHLRDHEVMAKVTPQPKEAPTMQHRDFIPADYASVGVYYLKDCAMWARYIEPGSELARTMYHKVATLYVPQSAIEIMLTEVYERMSNKRNIGILPTSIRSMFDSDVVQITYRNGREAWFMCDILGWKEVKPLDSWSEANVLITL